jgi:hypothetical protein
MSGFDLQIDEHAGHMNSRHSDEHHLSLDQLHHVQIHEAPNSRWRFILTVILLFALGFVLADILFEIAPWRHVPN